MGGNNARETLVVTGFLGLALLVGILFLTRVMP